MIEAGEFELGVDLADLRFGLAHAGLGLGQRRGGLDLFRVGLGDVGLGLSTADFVFERIQPQ